MLRIYEADGIQCIFGAAGLLLPCFAAIFSVDDHALLSHRPAASANARQYHRPEGFGRAAGLGLPALATTLGRKNRALVSDCPATLTVARNEYKYSAQLETQLGELPDVMCNVSELNQVFLNLIVNAAQAVRESGKSASNGRISITTERVRDHVRIRIADNGCGIPKENLEKIFDPFFTTKEVGLGTGQGLAIARAIVVEKHGGAIDVESEPGVGTAFILSLPIEGRCTPRVAA